MQSMGHPLRLFLVAVALPAAVVVADWWACRIVTGQYWSGPSVTFLYFLFVGQVGLLAFVIGRCLEHPLLRWTVFVWAIALVDLQVFGMLFRSGPAKCLAYALISGQVGLLAIWGILGAAPWPWRLPAVVVAAVPVAYLCLRHDYRGEAWGLVLLLQSVVAAGVCVFLRRRGFHLEPVEPTGQTPCAAPGGRSLQFGIAHMLVWTAALVPVLVFVRGLDLVLVPDLGWQVVLRIVSLGGCLAVVSLVAVWVALGKGSLPARLVVLAAGPPVVGTVLCAMTSTWQATLRGRLSGAFREIDYLGWWWVAWTCLAACFLAGLLLVFRESGYRLIRRLPGEQSLATSRS